MMAWDVLTLEQATVARRVVEEESRRRNHLVVALSGAHAYGFPSPDSDLDIKAVHAEPVESLVGLRRPAESFDRNEVVDGVEVDYTSNELRTVLVGMLQGNGNYIERVLGPCILATSPGIDELRHHARATLSRRVFHHYRGFADNQRRAFLDQPTAKRALYVFRTVLTGTHLLLTGEVVPDVTRHLEAYGFDEARALLEIKRHGEKVPLEPDAAGRWGIEMDRAFDMLADAEQRSVLPPEPRDTDVIERWLVEFRRATWKDRR
jgi:predicted nucleotidyltransferase